MILRKIYKHGATKISASNILRTTALHYRMLPTAINLMAVPHRNILMNNKYNNMTMSRVGASPQYNAYAMTWLNRPFTKVYNKIPKKVTKRMKKQLVKEFRRRKLAQASFNKSEELKKLSNYTPEKSKKEDVKIYSPFEALSEIIENQPELPFDESIDLCIKLGIDPIKSDQQVRAVVTMPSGTGRENRVGIFTTDEHLPIAEKAGADLIVNLNMIQDLNPKEIPFDTLIATTEAVKLLKPFGRTIGPLGLMPNIKSGTLVSPDDLEETVKGFKAGRIEIRNDDYAIVHACIGKRRFGKQDLFANLKALVDTLHDRKPEKSKGAYFRW